MERESQDSSNNESSSDNEEEISPTGIGYQQMAALPGLVNNIVGNVVRGVQNKIRKRDDSIDSRKSDINNVEQIIEEDYNSELLSDV